MKYLLAFVVLCLLTACDPPNAMIDAKRVTHSDVYWSDRKPIECAGSVDPQGCAMWWGEDRHTCFIQMPRDAPDAIIAHEFKHCFGFDHKNP